MRLDQINSTRRVVFKTDGIIHSNRVGRPRLRFGNMQLPETPKRARINPPWIQKHSFIVNYSAARRQMQASVDVDRHDRIAKGLDDAFKGGNSPGVSSSGQADKDSLAHLNYIATVESCRRQDSPDL